MFFTSRIKQASELFLYSAPLVHNINTSAFIWAFAALQKQTLLCWTGLDRFQITQRVSPPQPGSDAHLALVREAANFKLKHGRKKEAISDLEQLWKWVNIPTERWTSLSNTGGGKQIVSQLLLTNKSNISDAFLSLQQSGVILYAFIFVRYIQHFKCTHCFQC